MTRILVKLDFQLNVGSLDLMFQFQFGSSNEIPKFPMNLQNSNLEISASLMMSGTQKRSFGPYSEKLV